jgi:hypothetical protein
MKVALITITHPPNKYFINYFIINFKAYKKKQRQIYSSISAMSGIRTHNVNGDLARIA